MFLVNQDVRSIKLTFNIIFSFEGKVMMHLSKQRLFNFEEMFTIAFRASSYTLVSGSNTSYGNSLGKAPLISWGGGGFLYGKMVRVVVLSVSLPQV